MGLGGGAHRKPVMACGHRANATRTWPDGRQTDACVICAGDPQADQVVEGPDLTARDAECSSCKKRVPSTKAVAFFEYRGPGAPIAYETCRCGYLRLAHGQPGSRACRAFIPHGPWATDRHYDGCRGWD